MSGRLEAVEKGREREGEMEGDRPDDSGGVGENQRHGSNDEPRSGLGRQQSAVRELELESEERREPQLGHEQSQEPIEERQEEHGRRTEVGREEKGHLKQGQEQGQEQTQEHPQGQEQTQERPQGQVQIADREQKLGQKEKHDEDRKPKDKVEDEDDEDEDEDEEGVEDEDEDEEGVEEPVAGGGEGADASAAAGRVRGKGGNSLSDLNVFSSMRNFNQINPDILTQNSRDTWPPRPARRSVDRMLSVGNSPGVTYTRQGSEAGTSPACVNVNLGGRATHNSTLELNKDREVFVELPDLALCLEKLLRYKLVVITGPPGHGSNSLAYALCRAMQRKFKRDNIKVKVSNSWNEWETDGDHDKAQIVLINDMFGSFEVTYVEDWCKIFTEMKMCIHSSDKLYHIITCKSNILEEVFPKVDGKLFSEENIFRITTSYTEDKKKQFIANHANRAHLELSQLEIEHIAGVADDFGFPKCCQELLKRGTDKATLPMRFKHPTEVYMKDLVNVPRNVEAMLLLLMLEHPRSTCLDSTTRELTDVENRLLAAAGVQPGTLMSHLLIDARMFEGVYIEENKERKTVDFRSDNILYSVVKLFYIRHAEFILKHCKIDLLNRMVRAGTHTTPITVVMSPDQFVFFSDRCLEMLFTHRDLMNVCLHPAFLSVDFIDAFIDRAGDRIENLFHLKDRLKGQTWLYWSIWSKSGQLCRKTLSKMSSITFTDHTVSKRGHLSNVEETIVAACVSRNNEGLSALIRCSYNSHKFNTTRYDTGQLPKPGSEGMKCLVSCDTILEVACQYGSPEILKILINERSRIANQADFTALFQKCVRYNMNVALQVLLTQLREDIWVKEELQECLDREFDWGEAVKLPPLHFAITKKFQNIARTLLANGSETELLGAGLTAPQTAWETGNIEMFDFLVDCQGHFEFEDSTGQKPLNVAFKQQWRDLYLKMLSKKPNVNSADETGEPILHACRTGDLEMARRLVECRVKVNVSDSMGRTPLHMAVLKEDPQLITLLCTNGDVDVNAGDINGSTPLHVACDTIKPNFPHIIELLKVKPEIDAENNNSETPLHIAWKRSNIPLVRKLVEHGANCEVHDAKGNMLIHFAAEIGNLDLLKTLLDHDANVGAQNSCKQSSLHLACKMQDYEVLSNLLKPVSSLAHINDEDVNSFTPLHVACSLGNISMANLLILKGANVNAGRLVSPVQIALEKRNQMLFRKLVRFGGSVNKQHPMSKSTPLHDACQTDDEDMVTFLLENRAEVNITDAEGQTALHICCKMSNVRLAEKVMSPGNINTSDIHEKTALYRACQTGNISLVQLLAEQRPNTTRVDFMNHPCFAAFNHENYKSVVAVLQNNGFNINALNVNGESLLFCFCRKGSSDIVRKLLTCGATPLNNADRSIKTSALYAAVFYKQESIFKILLEQAGEGVIDSLDRHGDSLLNVACSTGNLYAVKTLLAHGADVNLRTKSKGQTQLHLVCNRYFTVKKDNHIGISLMEELLRKGADVNAIAKHGSTPLHILSKGNNVEMLKTLLTYRPNVNTRDSGHLTPLHVCLDLRNSVSNSFQSTAQILEALLDAEADVNALHPDKLSPVHTVVKERRSVILKILLHYKPNLEIKDPNGNMAIHVACRLKHPKMVAMLLDHQDHGTAVDSGGRYPIHVACEEDAQEVLQLILETGVDLWLQTKEDESRTVMDIAVSKNHSALVERLNEYSETTESNCVTVFKLIYTYLLVYIFVFVLDYPDLGIM